MTYNRTPREEVERMLDYLALQINSVEEECIVVPVGSYRRQKPFVHDIDLIISHPRESATKGLLRRILSHLHSIGTRSVY